MFRVCRQSHLNHFRVRTRSAGDRVVVAVLVQHAKVDGSTKVARFRLGDDFVTNYPGTTWISNSRRLSRQL